MDWSPMPVYRLVLAGLLVGWGTSLGNGCTSGHGICGISNMKLRSLVATCTFMFFGFVTAMAADSSSYFGGFVNTVPVGDAGTLTGTTIAICLMLLLVAHQLKVEGESSENSSTMRTVFVSISELAFGIAFGVGMGVSNMTKISATLSFLDLRYWNPALMFVMGGAMLITFPVFTYINGSFETPILDSKFYRAVASEVDSNLVFGAATFGIGWGLVGSCPGPAFVNLGSGNTPPFIVCASMIVGWWLHHAFADYMLKDKELKVHSNEKTDNTILLHESTV